MAPRAVVTPQMTCAVTCLVPLLGEWFDDDFGDVDGWRQRDDAEDQLGHFVGLQDALAMFVADRCRAFVEDGRVDFTRIEIRQANAIFRHFVRYACAEGCHGKFAGRAA